MEFSPLHWVVVLVVALILFGPKKIPEFGKGLGEGIKNFKEGLKGAASTTASTETPASTAPAPTPPPANTNQA